MPAKHPDEISQLEQEIVKRRLVIELFELEEIEGKLAGAFATKIAELNETIRLLRKRLGLGRGEGGERGAMPTVPPIAGAREGSTALPSSHGPPASAPLTAEAPPPVSATPTPLEPKSTRPAKRVTGAQEAKDGTEGEEAKEQDVEEELSRIRTDVEKLLDELEQMEQPRG